MGLNIRLWLRLVSCLGGLALLCSAFGNITGSYGSVSPNSLVYLRLTQTGGSLSGYMETFQASDLWGSGYESRSQGVEGRVDGRRFVLNSLIQGKAVGLGLRLDFPSIQGRSETVLVSPMSAAAWNLRVSSFKETQAVRVQVRDFQRALNNFVKAGDSEGSTSVEALQEAQRNKVKLAASLAAAQSRMTAAQSLLAAARSKAADADATAKEADSTAAELDAAADKDDAQTSRQRAQDARTLASQLSYAASGAHYRVSTAEYDVTSAQWNLANAQRAVDENDKRAFDASKILAELNLTVRILASEEGRQGLAKFARGQLRMATVNQSTLLNFYPSRDAQSIEQAAKGWHLLMVRISHSWSMVLVNGYLYWMDTSDLTPQSELSYSP